MSMSLILFLKSDEYLKSTSFKLDLWVITLDFCLCSESINLHALIGGHILFLVLSLVILLETVQVGQSLQHLTTQAESGPLLFLSNGPVIWATIAANFKLSQN